MLSEKPHISTETDNMDPVLLEELLLHIASLSAIYHKAPTTFIPHCKPRFLIPSPALRRQNYNAGRSLQHQDSYSSLHNSAQFQQGQSNNMRSQNFDGDDGGNGGLDEFVSSSKQPQHQRLSYHEQSFDQVAEASIGNQEYYEQKINAENPYRTDTGAVGGSQSNKGGGVDLMSFDL